MAIFHPFRVACHCGHGIDTQLAIGVNAGRSPEIKKQILDGQMHKVKCDRCNKVLTVEKDFFYFDLTRNTFIQVGKSSRTHEWKRVSEELHKQIDSTIPKSISGENANLLRVVFGLDELREKVLAQEAQLDDRVIEFLKVLVVYEHPFLLREPRLRLILENINEDKITFIASYEHKNRQFRISMPRWIVESTLSNQQELEDWFARVHKQDNIFKEKRDYWINMKRWSPQPSALDSLKQFSNKVREGKDINTSSKAFTNMLKYIPKGSHLPAWAKQDLRVIFEYAKKKNIQRLEDALFEIRFGIQLEDDWYRNDDPDDIDTLWNLLRELPDTNVEGNTEITEIQLDNERGGGWYYGPTGQIAIGENELGDRESFDGVVRHEVGHAVHERNKDLVDGWLNKQFGWKMFGTTSPEIDQWVELMGGWDAKMSAVEKSQVRSYLVKALGPGSQWDPPPYPAIPANHKWWKATFGPRLAFEHTHSNWFQGFAQWHRYKGNAFFLNYWYGTFCVVSEKTLDLIKKMPSNYASMSPFEFFAELYALFFDEDNPKRKHIPKDVVLWIEKNIGKPDAQAPFSPLPTPAAQATAWDWITRPEVERELVSPSKK